MAEILSEPISQKAQIPYITTEIVESALYVQKSADELLEATNPYKDINYVKKIRETVSSTLPAVYPVTVGAPTGPYIDGLLEKRKIMEKLDVSIRDGEVTAVEGEEEGATAAVNMWQRFSMMFMGVLFQFEDGLSPDQRW